MIIGLSGWVVSEYLNNVYFQGYVNSLSPVLLPVVSLVFGAASATVAVVVYFGMRNVRGSERSDSVEESRRRVQTVKSVRKSQGAEPRPARSGSATTGSKGRSSTAARYGSGRRGLDESSGKGSIESDE